MLLQHKKVSLVAGFSTPPWTATRECFGQRPLSLLVVLDVAEGKISVERAREVYGVVIHPEQLTLDREGTLALRHRLKNILAAAAD